MTRKVAQVVADVKMTFLFNARECLVILSSENNFSQIGPMTSASTVAYSIDVKNVFYAFYFKIKNAFFNVFYFPNVFY